VGKGKNPKNRDSEFMAWGNRSVNQANVMLEYPVQEALDLLDSKLKSASTSLVQVDEDLEYLKEQITTMEVNMARVYNDDVRVRREQKEDKS
jgi:hypothetical protein